MKIIISKDYIASISEDKVFKISDYALKEVKSINPSN